MAVPRSRYRALVFFVNIPIFCVKKDYVLKLGGHRESWVVIFGQGPASEGEMGVPPKKISNFFPEIFCQCIDRKSQEVSATYVKPLGHDRR